MKIFKIMGAAGVFALASLASAATSDSVLRVKVPFAFEVAGENFAPGEYLVHESRNGLILVEGGRKAAMALSIPDAPAKSGEGSTVRFVRTAEGSRLSAVQVEGLETRAIPASVAAVHKRTLTISH